MAVVVDTDLVSFLYKRDTRAALYRYQLFHDVSFGATTFHFLEWLVRRGLKFLHRVA